MNGEIRFGIADMILVIILMIANIVAWVMIYVMLITEESENNADV